MQRCWPGWQSPWRSRIHAASRCAPGPRRNPAAYCEPRFFGREPRCWRRSSPAIPSNSFPFWVSCRPSCRRAESRPGRPGTQRIGRARECARQSGRGLAVFARCSSANAYRYRHDRDGDSGARRILALVLLVATVRCGDRIFDRRWPRSGIHLHRHTECRTGRRAVDDDGHRRTSVTYRSAGRSADCCGDRGCAWRLVRLTAGARACCSRRVDGSLVDADAIVSTARQGRSGTMALGP